MCFEPQGVMFFTVFLLFPTKFQTLTLFSFNHDIPFYPILSFLLLYLIFSQGHAITQIYQTTRSIWSGVQDEFYLKFWTPQSADQTPLHSLPLLDKAGDTCIDLPHSSRIFSRLSILRGRIN